MRARQQRRLEAKIMQSWRSLTFPSFCKQKQNREIQKKGLVRIQVLNVLRRTQIQKNRKHTHTHTHTHTDSHTHIHTYTHTHT